MFEAYRTEFIISGIILAILGVTLFISNVLIRKIGRKSGINDARIQLINRYVAVTFILLALIFLAFIFGTDFKELAFILSSVFAVLGIALFAVWSILSNVTSGIIMFFSFPYKVGDKIKIHDSDFPIEAIIEDIRMFQLHLKLDNGDLVTYPNNLMLQKPVTLVQKDAIEELEVEEELP